MDINNFANFINDPNKSELTCRKLQELAAELMSVNDKTNALKLYNRSIAVSPTNSVDLPIAFANKSAVLLEMKYYDACIGNINLALKHPACPFWLLSALLERKIKCLLIMNQWSDSTKKKIFKIIKRLPISKQDKSVLKIRLNHFILHILKIAENVNDKLSTKLDTQNTFLFSVEKLKEEEYCGDSYVLYSSDDIELVQNRTYGRHIVAKNEINTGELLLKERAIISCPYPNEIYDYCSCCLIRTYVLIPCNRCSKALFCSKRCANRALEHYHHIECSLMDYFVSMEPEDQHVQYIMRLFCFLSHQGKMLNELIDKWRIMKFKKENDFNVITKSYQLPEDFQSLFLSLDKYSYSLAQFEYSRRRYSKLVEKLLEKTEFFNRLIPNVNNQNYEYVIDMLVDIEAHFKCNSFCVSDIIYSNDEETSVLRKNVGLACYRKSNIFNHSCVPNAAYYFENGDILSTYSLRKIRPGEQLFICYLNTYYEAEKPKRDLVKSYSFECRCVACEENWPSFDLLQSVYDIRFCECEHHNAVSRRMSITGCRFCRFKRDLAASLKLIKDALTANSPFNLIVDNLKENVSQAMDLFQSLEGIEIHLIKEYVELYRLYCRCIEISGNSKI